jgi:pilus assembly protein Flp/PilA
MLALLTRIQSRFTGDERGASLVEYALLITFIAIVAVTAVAVLGQQVSDGINEVNQGL